MALRFVIENVDREALCNAGLSEWNIPDYVEEVTLVIHDEYVEGAQESSRSCICDYFQKDSARCPGSPSEGKCQAFMDEGANCWWWPEYWVGGKAQ